YARSHLQARPHLSPSTSEGSTMTSLTRDQQTAALEKDWADNPRWKGVRRTYSAADVVKLRGSLQIDHTLARRGAEKLWNLVNTEPFINALGALTGNQAMQQVKAGLKAIYLSGWQVAGDANSNGEMYPDQSLYSVDSVPKVVKKINNTFQRADQIQWSEGKNDIDFFAPIIADAEAADLVTSDVDDTDKPFCTGERTIEGFYRTKPGLEQAVSRALAYAEVADLVWCETGKPDLAYAKAFADAVHKKFPGKLLAYN